MTIPSVFLMIVTCKIKITCYGKEKKLYLKSGQSVSKKLYTISKTFRKRQGFELISLYTCLPKKP